MVSLNGTILKISNAPPVALGGVLEGGGKRRERGSGESGVRCDRQAYSINECGRHWDWSRLRRLRCTPVALGAGGLREAAGARGANGTDGKTKPVPKKLKKDACKVLCLFGIIPLMA
ncbi:hypothetical protein B0H13DRAFT_1866275 [Mycena leptocephala]|nr:hypothetical protein B0H13DRAFT_1866275 [Mycena leptocephala]